ncbi:aminopeptidase [Brumimicrobium salinarum]|uniref:Aminopeptidase n=1 Tax=Brumimicrobium salinarum TaxID=2058658 RepID=A0A2I0R6Y2_9FLAO|nr:aminopeptidase [Brumimicrobium salinarum]
MKEITFLIACVFLTELTFSQNLYQPRSVKQAYENGTRAMDGKPGENYWQNRGVYDMHITIDPPNRTIKGKQTISYTNSSPDTLKELRFKLILNHHKPAAPRLRTVTDDYLTSGMHINSYTENGVQAEWNSENDGINKKIRLQEPLAPNSTIELGFDWHFDVSKQSGREGAIDSTTFFLAYFYPRVAVYDDYEGWDRMPYAGSQEFYNNFNDYTFQVTVPKDYIVWATGDLLNPREVLTSKYADLLEKSMVSDEVIRIVDQEDVKKGGITQQKESNTWKWKTDNINDISIATSNHYNWDAGSVVVDNKTGRRASFQSAYDESSKDFKKMVEYGKNTLKWFSNNTPGVPYPYSKMTVVRGFANMEYPMMANDSSNDDEKFTRFVMQHEVAHTYFPFYMGINETRFAFMDEGWATTFEYLIGIEDLGYEKATANFKQFRVERWSNNNSLELDLPIITPSNIMSGLGAGTNSYGKAALAYLALRDYLGEEKFLSALHGFMDRWNGKHPIPWDMFYSFNDITRENLNWFWYNWFFSNNYMDVALKEVEVDGKKVTLQIENIGGMAVPFDVKVKLKNGKTKTFHQTPAVWKEDLTQTTIKLENLKNIVEIKIEGGIWMDADPENNNWKKKD